MGHGHTDLGVLVVESDILRVTPRDDGLAKHGCEMNAIRGAQQPHPAFPRAGHLEALGCGNARLGVDEDAARFVVSVGRLPLAPIRGRPHNVVIARAIEPAATFERRG